MTVDMDQSASPAGVMRPQSAVYPLQGFGTSDFPVNCAPMASSSDGGVFDYMSPAMAHHRHLRAGSNASTPTGAMAVNMMGSFASQQQQQQQQQQQYAQSPAMHQSSPYAASSPYADSRGMYAQSVDGTSGALPSTICCPSTVWPDSDSPVMDAGSQAFRATDPPPINLPHKRILDEIQGSQRDLWRNDSPVSVSAPIFRQSPHGVPLQNQPQPHVESMYSGASTGLPAGVSSASSVSSNSVAFKPSLSPPPLAMPAAFRLQPASMGPFGSLEQVWTPFM